MNVYARFDEIPSITLEDIKKTKRYGRTHARTHGRTDGRTDNVKTVYPGGGGIKILRERARKTRIRLGSGWS